MGASFNISDDLVLIQAKKGIQLKLDRKNYSISGKSLYDQYVESCIISKDGYFSPNLFRDIAKKIPIKPERSMILPFSIFILPSRLPIEIVGKAKERCKMCRECGSELD
ncbi:MAG: hypothetical protein WBY28_05305 [Nitrososphaeraceae archaeon]